MNDVEAENQSLALPKAFVFLLAYLVVVAWLLSLLGTLRWVSAAALPGLIAAVWLARRVAGGGPQLWDQLREPLKSWPVVVVGFFVLAGALWYPPTTMDAISYRTPRILLWLQAGHVHHVASVDERLDFLPQVWELASAPLYAVGGDRLFWVWSFLSWLIGFVLFFGWARAFGQDSATARRLAFLANASTFAVVQAGEPDNSLVAAGLVLLGLRFVLAFHQTRAPGAINWAVLSLGLAGGCKPNFLTLGLPFAIWFLVGPGKPWRSYRWRWLPAWLPLWVLASPLPAFFMNYLARGDWSGLAEDPVYGSNPLGNLVLGSVMLIWQMAQPPVNPLFFIADKWLDPLALRLGAAEIVPRFQFVSTAVALPENASIGLVATLLLAAGCVRAVRHKSAGWTSWPVLAALAGLVGLYAALFKVVPQLLGRSYCAYVLLAFPLAMLGWSSFSARALRGWVCLSLLSALAALVFCPARPLWPAQALQKLLSRDDRTASLARSMAPYVIFLSRASTAEELVKAIPSEERRIVVLTPYSRPLLPLWRPSGLRREIVLLPRDAPVERLRTASVNYVLVSGGAEPAYPELCHHLRTSGEYREVMARDYVSILSVGAETWRLYHREARPPE